METAWERPLRIRRRRDLIVATPAPDRPDRRTLKDPITQRFFHLSAEEFALFDLLTREQTPANWREEFERRFAPRRVSQAELQRFLARLHRDGLVVSDAAAQGEQLFERRERKRTDALFRLPQKLLAWRLRGISPRAILDVLTPAVGFAFSIGGAIASVLLFVFTFGFLLSRSGDVARRLPDLETFLSGGDVLWLLLVLAAVKTLHELGHAIACRTMGGECSEIGLQFLFGAPCLYSNVSDAWLLPDRWSRIAISAAGIYVELWLASGAAWLWWWSEPGFINALCLKTILVCSAGTLLFNANPLIRSDGYYILSDWLRLPNLESRALTALADFCRRTLLDLQPTVRLVGERPRPGLAWFGAAAIVYRGVLVFSLYWAGRTALAAYRVETAADALLAIWVLGGVMILVSTTRQAVNEARRRGTAYLPRLIAAAVSAGLILAAAVWIPLPQRIFAPAVVEVDGAAHVYLRTPGRLVSAATAGETVARGGILATVVNEELEWELSKLETERDGWRIKVEQWAATAVDDPAASAALPAAREALADLTTRVAQLQGRLSKLTLTAPRAGTILPPPRKITPAATGRLATWNGTPLDLENRGADLPVGTLLCLVGDPNKLTATAVLDQAEVDLITPGQSVRISVGVGSAAVDGRVREVARIDLTEPPPHLAAAGLLPVRTTADGSRPAHAAYAATIEIDAKDSGGVFPGAVGHAAIQVAPQPLANRIRRWIAATFRLPR